MNEAELNEARIELAQRIFDDARDCTGSEICQGMNRALNATDQETLDAIEKEFLVDEDQDDDGIGNRDEAEDMADTWDGQ